MEKSPFTNVHDVKEKAHRAFANISDDVVKRCIAHTVDQENFYRYLHNMEPCTPEVVETIPETVDVQSDSDLIEQDPIEEIIVRDQDQQMVASLPSDSSFVQQDPNVENIVVDNEDNVHVQSDSDLVERDPIEDIIVRDQEQHEVASLPSDSSFVQQDSNVDNIVVDNEDNVVNAIIEVDIEHIEAPENPFHVCSMCNYKTLSLSKFSLHLKTQYRCNHCGEIFHGMHGKRNYKRHVINHEKPAKPESYKCSECKKTFPLKANLKRHIKCAHNSLKKPKKTYNCTMCTKYFSYPSLIKRHMKLVHESSTNCLICDKNFSFPSQLKNHMAKKHTSMSKKINYAINFDTLPIQIPEVVGYQQEKIDSETDKDEIKAQNSFLSNNEQTKKSRRKQKMALRKEF